MRILHVVPTYLPARRYGGPIVSVHGLCRALAARGHEVSVFTTNVDGHGVSDVPVETPVELDGVRVTYFPSPLTRLYWSPRMRRAMKNLQFDIGHLHSVFLWPTAAAGSALRRASIPYVISPRGMLVSSLIEARSKVVKTAWLSLVERRNFAGASAIHFTSAREQLDAERIGLPINSPVVIPNGVDVPASSGRERNPKQILFLGRVNWKKGLDRLIAATELIPDATLVIAGNDEEGLEASLPVSPRVRFAGPVNDEQKQELLAESALLVLPSINENFGNVVLEALAASTPVVVTPGVGLAADVAESRSGLVSEGDPQSLASAIGALLADADLRGRMGKRGLELVTRKFTWAQVAAQMEDAYQCLIASRRSS